MLNSSMSTKIGMDIWFGSHLPEVTGTYQDQLDLVEIYMGSATLLVLATIIPLMITRY